MAPLPGIAQGYANVSHCQRPSAHFQADHSPLRSCVEPNILDVASTSLPDSAARIGGCGKVVSGDTPLAGGSPVVFAVREPIRRRGLAAGGWLSRSIRHFRPASPFGTVECSSMRTGGGWVPTGCGARSLPAAEHVAASQCLAVSMVFSTATVAGKPLGTSVQIWAPLPRHGPCQVPRAWMGSWRLHRASTRP